MSFTSFPHGVSSFGIPVVGNGISVPNRNGKVLFVDPDGLAPRSFSGRAFKTISDALAQIDGPDGSTIFVFPGTYTENIVITQDYVTIIGAQHAGYARPDIGALTGTVPLTVSAQGFRAVGCRFFGTASDCVVQNGNGFEYTDCVFDGDLTAAKAGVRLVGALLNGSQTHYTASEGVIQNSLFRGNALGVVFDTAAAPVGVGSTDNVIKANTFDRNTQDIVTKDTGTGTYSVQNALIQGNQFVDKNKTNYIDTTTANGGAASDQSGAINGNTFAADSITTTNIAMVGTAFTFSGNFDTVGVVNGSALD
jgi:hypothetical protein